MQITNSARISIPSGLEDRDGFLKFMDHLGRVFQRVFMPSRAGFYGTVKADLEGKNWFVNDEGYRASVKIKELSPEEQGCPKILRIIEVVLTKIFGSKKPVMEGFGFPGSGVAAARKGNIIDFDSADGRYVSLVVEDANFGEKITRFFVTDEWTNRVASPRSSNQTRESWVCR